MKMYRPHRLCPRNSKPKEPSLYRSLCVSILCMFLSTVMLVGTTMAWFSDSLQTGVYTITSASFSTTVYYCTDLSNANNTPNNWQRLNPSNTTMFGGGSLSSGGSQVVYLKLVNNSDMPLKYKFTLTAFEGNNSIELLSLAGCQSTKGSEGNDVALTESDLNVIDPSKVTPDAQNSKEVTFEVPKETDTNNPSIVYAVLKLTYTGSSVETPISNIYNFSLKLAITQDRDGAGETESNSLPTPNTAVTIEIGDTSSDPDTTNTNGDGNPQPVEVATGDGNVGTPPSSTDETGTPSGASDTGTTSDTSDTDTSGGNGDTTVTENGSET